MYAYRYTRIHTGTRVYTYSQGVSDQVCRLDCGTALQCGLVATWGDLAPFLDSVAQSNGEEALASWVLGEGWEGSEVNRCPGRGGGPVEGGGARQNRVTPVSRSRWGRGAQEPPQPPTGRGRPDPSPGPPHGRVPPLLP